MKTKTTASRRVRGLDAAAVGLGLALLAAQAQAAPAGSASELADLELYFSDEQLVEAPTRHPKPIYQVAEDVTVVTAEEIEAMHAHTVAEVLERVPGVFIQPNGRDFANLASIHIQGSDYEHVLVLLDGIRWNDVSSDFAVTNNIPVQIIDRIEVVKGAGSSTWGSALGGVVNIITKETGKSRRPHGQLEFAAGERDTEHYHAEVAGGAESFGYYLFGGRRESAGIKDDRFFDSKSLYSKLSYQLPGHTRFTGLLGYSQPENKYISFQPYDMAAVSDTRSLWYSTALESSLGHGLQLYLQAYGRDYRNTDYAWLLSSGEVFDRPTKEGKQRGLNGRLAWEAGRHTVVLGAEYLHRDLTNHNDLTNAEAAPLNEEILAVYLNDTFRLGRLTVTPGFRYDHFTLGDDQANPSLGFTYRITENTLLRASTARGFRKSALELVEGDPAFNWVNPNPNLESETIWTTQAGVETTAVPFLWLKATLFYHDADHVWNYDADNNTYVNTGSVQRTGVELAAKTAPFHGFNLGANYTLVHLEPARAENDELYETNLLLEYQNQAAGFHGQLFGHYVWWSDPLFSGPADNGQFDDFLWDLVLRQNILNFPAGEAELFFKAHNLFNGTQYWHEAYENAPRWVEAGLTIRF